MSGINLNWPSWAPRLLWTWSKCPRCNSIQFKPAELRPFDPLLGLLALHPVRCMFCWRRYYLITLRGVVKA